MPKQKKENITVDEMLRRLESDPEYMRRKSERDRAIAAHERQSRAEQAELLGDLEGLGVKVGSVWDLVNTSEPYREAFPVLLKHLQRPYSSGTREGIARSLAVKAARPIAWKATVEEYCKTESSDFQVKDGLAVALAGMSDEAVMPELIELAKDKRHGESRVLLLLGIKRSRLQIARDAIGKLADDPQLATEIKSWRRKHS